MAANFLPYHEPSIIQILILISFFIILSLAEYASAKILRAGIIGQIAVGIIYGVPLANILVESWQETFLALGYVGLILIIFEGGLSARLDLLKANLVLSLVAAATGIVFPIGLSYLLLYLGVGYGAVETFIIGAALSATSIGTTFAVLSASSSGDGQGLGQTRVGTVLVSAAVIDDVSGLVMSSVIGELGSQGANLGWLIGRPILAAVAIAAVTPLVTKFCLAPMYRSFVERRLLKIGGSAMVVFMALILAAFITIASYAGTSVLFGAFIAGLCLGYLPSPPTKERQNQAIGIEDAPQPDAQQNQTFAAIFEEYIGRIQAAVLAPLFFASIGFAIPFLSLWSGRAVWRGILYSLLMLVGKAVVGLCIPLWDVRKSMAAHNTSASMGKALPAAMLLGCAMVARGEIGLLIVQIGYNSTSFVSEEGFTTAIWAILLNTILGPIAVGILVKFSGEKILNSKVWGIDDGHGGEGEELNLMFDEEITKGRPMGYRAPRSSSEYLGGFR